MLQRPAGFSLLELLLTCLILCLVTGLALPTLAGVSERHHVRTAMTSLTSHMQLARITAITHNRRTVLCPSQDGLHCTPDRDWSGGWLLFVDEDGNRRVDRAEDILRVESTPTSHRLRITSSLGRQQLRYLPDGSSAGTNLTLSICNQAGLLVGQVIVNNAGRPRSQLITQPLPCPG